MLKILINSNETMIGEPLPKEIEYLNIFFEEHPLQRTTIGAQEAVFIKKWFNDVVDRFIGEYITFNNMLIRKQDVNKFKL